MSDMNIYNAMLAAKLAGGSGGGGGGFSPTSDQLAAMNSGITAERVGQLEGIDNTGDNYIEINGLRIYFSTSDPTGTIPANSLLIGSGSAIKKYSKTAQLFDYTTMANGKLGYFLTEDGEESESGTWAISDYIPCDGTEFTIHQLGGNTPSICLYDEEKQYITGKKYNTGAAGTKSDITITSSEEAKFIRFSWYRYQDNYDNPSLIMLNNGLTSLPYESYGYSWK